LDEKKSGCSKNPSSIKYRVRAPIRTLHGGKPRRKCLGVGEYLLECWLRQDLEEVRTELIKAAKALENARCDKINQVNG